MKQDRHPACVPHIMYWQDACSALQPDARFAPQTNKELPQLPIVRSSQTVVSAIQSQGILFGNSIMTLEIAIVLAILVVSLILFISEKIRMDVVALLVLVTLAFTGLVTPTEALAGFSNPAVITVWAMFILSAGLTETGVAAIIGRQVLRLAGTQETRMIIVIMLYIFFVRHDYGSKTILPSTSPFLSFFIASFAVLRSCLVTLINSTFFEFINSTNSLSSLNSPT